MPHINAIFIENKETRHFLERNANRFRKIVANATGYGIESIAVIPQSIKGADVIIAANTLPLEFVIDVGTKITSPEHAHELSESIKKSIVKECVGGIAFHFGVWIRGFPINGYSEYQKK